MSSPSKSFAEVLQRRVWMDTPIAPVGLTLLMFIHGLQGHPHTTWTSDPKSAQRNSRQALALPRVPKRDKARALSPFGLISRYRTKSRSIEEEALDNIYGEGNQEAEAKNVFWPGDLLKEDFPMARIMTFGCNTSITQGYEAANQGNIFSHARDLLYGLEAKRRQSPNRDLVFIAHSLGGILVGEVLRRSEVDPDQKIAKIFGSTTGVFFFGTPHRGSRDWASFGEGVAAIAGHILGVDVNTQVIHALLPSGPELEICRESFAAQWVKRGDNLTVRTFQESKGVTGTQWGGFNQLIVPPDSSTLDHPSQRARTIDADHIGMVKFSGKNDKAYEMVKEDIEELVTRAREAVHSLVSDQPKQQKEVEWSEKECKCQQLLRTSDYESYKDRNPDRAEGTCQWFLKHSNFQTWYQSNTSSLLWVSADPGCGKSVLSKSLVEKELKSTESRTTCYFFFKDDDIKQKTVTYALSALLHQLFSQKKFLIQHAILDYESEGSLLPTLFHKLWTILTKAATDPNAGEVVCILDVLDECEESGRYDIIKALSAFYKNNTEGNPSRFKFLATSRPYLDIERRFTELTHDMPTVHLKGEKESKAISEEISLVIHLEAHKKIGLELNLNDSDRSFLEHKLSSMPHRTYLWLKLILEVIRRRTSVTRMRIQEIISNLPTTVETAYEAILEKSSDKRLARKLLCIVVAAVRPLTLNEMNIALAIEDHHRSSKDLDLEDEIGFEGTVRHLCGLFISVIDQKVYLIHQRAKEFLLAKPELCSGVWKYSIEPAVSELIVAKTCITYLLFVEFSSNLDIGGKSRAEDESTVKHHTDKHHYFGYAACQWPIHYKKAQARAEHGMLQSILDICDTQSQRFRNWFYIYWTPAHPYELTPRFISSITVVSYFGLEAVVKLLLEKGVELDSEDRDGREPLSWAVVSGHEATVKLLLEKGVGPDSKGRWGQTPLSWAVGKGHEAVVKLLLEKGIEPDSEDRDGRTLLSWAAGGGHEAIVKLLLKKGVKPDSKDKGGQTPLLWAARNGHETIMKLLLEKGVKLDSKGGDSQTPLSWASGKGHEAVVKLLLEKGVEPDYKDRDGRTPLSWATGRGDEICAAGSGHEAIVKLLLEKGVEPDSKDRNGRTPLSWAAETGHKAWAAENGHEAIVKLLLKEGVEPDSEDSDGRTPLSWAAQNGNETIVKLLLEKGVEPDSKDRDGRTPLSWATERGHEVWTMENGREAIVKLLLDKGVEPDPEDSDSRTPLSWAAQNGHEAIVKLLLEKGAEPDSKDRDGQTPLSWAAKGGHDAVVKLLLATKKVDVESKDANYGRTPLLWAAGNGHEAIVKLLAPITSDS